MTLAPIHIAQRLGRFLGNITSPDDRQSHSLPTVTPAKFKGEVSALEHDVPKALLDISTRYHSKSLVRRSDYYFLILKAKQAVHLTKRNRVNHRSIKGVLEMTLALWSLCKGRDQEYKLERFLLGNLSGSHNMSRETIETRIPVHIRETAAQPAPKTLELALCNPEVMLRDRLFHIHDTVLHARLSKYFRTLYHMAVRYQYLNSKQPLFTTIDEDHYRPNVTGTVGPRNMLSFSHGQDRNLRILIALRNVSVTANTLLESEELIDAFTPLTRSDLSYRSENFCVIDIDNIKDIHPRDDVRGKLMFQTPGMQTWITRGEYDVASKAIDDLLADARVQTALGEAYERFGTI
ncbi:MAG: hypothetical protein FWD68_01940 [Alphaproteobacteria bacterium]|nr:hypothetical protein [Alphaproteobacteria bacterium]